MDSTSDEATNYPKEYDKHIYDHRFNLIIIEADREAYFCKEVPQERPKQKPDPQWYRRFEKRRVK